MLQIIDRRLAGKNKSIGNRERFLRRHKEQIREAVKRAVDGRGIRDLAQGEDVHIPKRDISEPVFRHGPGRQAARWSTRQQGTYVTGRPPSSGLPGRRTGQGQPGQQPRWEGDDDFVFHLRQGRVHAGLSSTTWPCPT
jgi:uncharacterized sporulation protein YeaH/YhbH (DUF444 family)